MTHCEILKFGYNAIPDCWRNSDMEHVRPHPFITLKKTILQHVLNECQSRYKNIIISDLKSMLNEMNGASSVDSREVMEI